MGWIENFEQPEWEEPIIVSRVGLGDDWLPPCLSDVVEVKVDEAGSYIVTDHETVVYGAGDTALEALCDYVVSLIEYIGILWKRT